MKYQRLLGGLILALFGTVFLATAASAADPIATTTVAEAQADPIWAENGITAVGQDVPAQWLDRTFWDTPHTFTTPGVIAPQYTGRGLSSAGFKHTFNGAEISTVMIDVNNHKVTAWRPGNPAPVACPSATPCTGLGAGRAMGSDFQLDPLAWFAGKLADAAKDLLAGASTWALQHTQPDLTRQWWVDAYWRSATLGVIGFGVIAVIGFARVSRGRIDGYRWVEETGGWAVAFFAGIALGPPLAVMVIDGSGVLAQGIVAAWGGTGPAPGIGQISTAIDAYRVAGNSVIACLLFVAVLIATLGVFVQLAVQGAVLYLSSAVFAIGWMWVASHRQKETGFKVPLLFGGICAAKPLMFLLLGIGMDIVRDGIATPGDTGAMINSIVMGVFILGLVALAPALLLKFAPVSPGEHWMLPGHRRFSSLVGG